MFGGPVPLKDPISDQVIGYYDHQAANAGLKITGAYAAVAPIFQPGSWMGDLLAEVAPGGASAISDGIEEAIRGHHPWPKYLGGRGVHKKTPLRDSLHRAFHSQLGSTMRQLGYPPVGGVTGSTPKWADYFIDNPGSREKALELLRQTTADFDRTNGTSIGPKLEQALKGGAKPPK